MPICRKNGLNFINRSDKLIFNHLENRPPKIGRDKNFQNISNFFNFKFSFALYRPPYTKSPV